MRPLKDDPKDEPKETNETMQRPEGGQAGNPVRQHVLAALTARVPFHAFFSEETNTNWAFVTGKNLFPW